MRRVGLLGGTFDPPHAAHLALARAALGAGAVDVVFVVPAGDPWQKSTSASAEDRLAMTRIAFRGEPGCEVSDAEVARSGPTYAIDTVRALRALGNAVRYIVGSDALATLPTWHAVDELVGLADFLVVARPGVPVDVPAIPGLTTTVLRSSERDEASRDIRARILATGARPDGIDDGVWSYIVEHGLYGVGHA